MQLQYGENRFTVAADAIVVGSDAAAAIRLAGDSVASRHAVIRQLGANTVVEPVGPSPVAVNGSPIGRDHPTPLLHGDRINVGGHEIVVIDDGLETGAIRVGGAVEPGRHAAPPEAAPRLVSVSDGREYRVNIAPFVFGREPTAAVVVTSPDSSRRHAEIVQRPDGDVLVDLSSNGTYVNGARVSGRHQLKALDVIRIGAEEFRYYPAPARPAGPPPAPDGAAFKLGDTMVGLPKPSGPPVAVQAPRAAPPALASLLVKRGQLKGERLSVSHPLVSLGRAEYNDLRIPDTGVSASHAKLQLRDGVWVIADVGSTNGTTVDGIPITDETPLSPGSEIGLGDVRLLFEPRDRNGALPDAGTPVIRPAMPMVHGPRSSDQAGRRLWPAVVVVILLAVVAALALLS